jgi:hypothetical protein
VTSPVIAIEASFGLATGWPDASPFIWPEKKGLPGNEAPQKVLFLTKQYTR